MFSLCLILSFSITFLFSFSISASQHSTTIGATSLRTRHCFTLLLCRLINQFLITLMLPSPSCYLQMYTSNVQLSSSQCPCPTVAFSEAATCKSSRLLQPSNRCCAHTLSATSATHSDSPPSTEVLNISSAAYLRLLDFAADSDNFQKILFILQRLELDQKLSFKQI